MGECKRRGEGVWGRGRRVPPHLFQGQQVRLCQRLRQRHHPLSVRHQHQHEHAPEGLQRAPLRKVALHLHRRQERGGGGVSMRRSMAAACAPPDPEP